MIIPSQKIYNTSLGYRHDPKKEFNSTEIVDKFKKKFCNYMDFTPSTHKHKLILKFSIILYKYTNFMQPTDALTKMSFTLESKTFDSSEFYFQYKSTEEYWVSAAEFLQKYFNEYENRLIQINLDINEY
jgi:hypothetical protein